jgi:hypothetical protein
LTIYYISDRDKSENQFWFCIVISVAIKGGDTMITVDQAVEMVTRGGYTYEEVYPLLSAKDQVLFQWSVIA